jgi:hypothetical protein
MKPNALKQLQPEKPKQEQENAPTDELAELKRRIERIERHGRARGWSFED